MTFIFTRIETYKTSATKTYFICVFVLYLMSSDVKYVPERLKSGKLCAVWSLYFFIQKCTFSFRTNRWYRSPFPATLAIVYK